MKTNPLKVVQTEAAPVQKKSRGSKRVFRSEAEGKFDRMWKQNPEQFNPGRNARELSRINRTKLLLKGLEGQKIADLGSGFGTLACFCHQQGAQVDAVDISSLALEQLPAEVGKRHDFIPTTTLPESSYDLVLCTDLIAHTPVQHHRLLAAEIARLLKREGKVICSTSIDISSEDALRKFLALMETEFTIEETICSRHFLWIQIKKGLELFKEAPLLDPLYRWFNKSERALQMLEAATSLLYPERGVSHVIVVGKLKRLFG